ncbi:MAG: iron-sulfur cluster repair di-iron protein [Cytophagaceae bacterium]
MEPQKLDVRVIEPRLKHPTIFNTFDSLNPGEAFIIVNDHDPKPLYYQMLAERPNQFNWEYLENGPYQWQVRIDKSPAGKEQTVGKLAAEDYRKALVFKRFGIDFCCGGKKTLAQAAQEKGVNIDELQHELDLLDQEDDAGEKDFNNWEPSKLIDYILEKHHVYVKTRLPEIKAILYKVVNVHVDSHLELFDLHTNFSLMHNDLMEHLYKEENILFPYIKELEITGRTDEEHPGVKGILKVMEQEHEAAGEFFENIKKITTNYQAPKGACGSFRMLYSLLEEFDEDLKQHVHLENNILFPKALKLENGLFA